MCACNLQFTISWPPLTFVTVLMPHVVPAMVIQDGYPAKMKIIRRKGLTSQVKAATKGQIDALAIDGPPHTQRLDLVKQALAKTVI